MLNQKEFNKSDVNVIAKNSLNEYILEFDLQYPKKLYELHNDYQSAPEELEISHDILPKYCSGIANKYDINLVLLN